MTNSTKKQNRILLVSLVLILTCAAVLIAITGGANRKKAEDNPSGREMHSETVPDKSLSDGATGRKSDRSDAPIESIKPKKADSSNGDSLNDGSFNESEKKAQNASDDITEDIPTSATADTAISDVSDVLPTFSAPVDMPVIKEYSGSVPVFSYTMNDYRVHNALDFAASEGTPVFAAAEGRISEITDDPMMGICISVKHPGGAVTCYKGLSEESMSLCSVGDNVTRGQTIGSVGNTALIESAEESHLHFEMSVNGNKCDPSEYFDVIRLSAVNED